MLLSSLILTALVSATPVDFDTEILPILTKSGCNSGACHGAASGRGGFKLSLFAGDPAADHAAIALELEGRRINVVKANRSLVLAKPCGDLDHEGGQLFESDSPEFKSIERWISDGAMRHGIRKLEELRIEPTNEVVRDLNAPINVKVTARFDDGKVVDVTRWAIFTPADSAAVIVEPSGHVKLLRRGWHTIAVRFLDQLGTIQITVPVRDDFARPVPLAEFNWIDRRVNQRIEDLRLEVSPQAADGRLLRRLRLDLTGRLPSERELEQFTNSNDKDKLNQWIEQWLRSDEFVDFWTYRLGRWLHVSNYAVRGDPRGAAAYHGWLREQVAREVGWDEIARQLLTATGDSHVVGAANFHRQAVDARAEGELVASAFLGVELRCANCHNHPLDRWTQDDYHGLAAIFARLDRNQLVALRTRGEITNPATGTPIQPRLPGGGPADRADPREALADWLTAPANAYFAKAFANRVWKELLGRGLIEPSDAIRATNPATHPELLQQLADELVTNRFQLRPLIRQIVQSAAYQRDSDMGSSHPDPLRFYAQATARPLTPEVYVDAVNDVLGDSSKESPQRHPIRAIQRPDALLNVEGLASLSGCGGSKNCAPGESLATDLATRLELINGQFLNTKISGPTGFLAPLLARDVPTEEIVTRCYQRALSRVPTRAERDHWEKELNADAATRTAKLHDFVWSLLNSQEFTTNH